jgi:hypothetical protein
MQSDQNCGQLQVKRASLDTIDLAYGDDDGIDRQRSNRQPVLRTEDFDPKDRLSFSRTCLIHTGLTYGGRTG